MTKPKDVDLEFEELWQQGEELRNKCRAECERYEIKNRVDTIHSILDEKGAEVTISLILRSPSGKSITLNTENTDLDENIKKLSKEIFYNLYKKDVERFRWNRN